MTVRGRLEATLAALVIPAAIAACSGSASVETAPTTNTTMIVPTTSATPTAASTPVTTATPKRATTTTTRASVSPRAVLASVSLTRPDAAAGYDVRLWPSGNAVDGQVTHDLCGAPFASEDRRVARHEVSIVDPRGDTTNVASEAVLYDSPAGAQQALEELRDAHDHCPAGPVKSGFDGVPDATYRFAPTPDASWPATDGVSRYAVDFTATDAGGGTYHELEVDQVRGRLLVVLYVQDPDEVPAEIAASVGDIPHLAQLIAGRMAAVPESVISPTT